MAARESSSSVDSSSSDSRAPFCQHVDEELLLKGDGFPGCSRRETRGRRLNVVCIAWVSAAVSAVSLVVAAAFVVFLLLGNAPPSARQAAATARDEVCLPCLHLTSDPVSDSRWLLVDVLDVRKDEDNIDICCARTNAQLAALLRLIIQRQRVVEELADILEPAEGQYNRKPNSSAAVSAHLVFKPGSGNNEVQQWRGPKDSSLAHVQPGLTFHDNTLYVITPGLYYVYCHITYDNFTSSSQVASSYVYRDSLVLPQTSGIVLKTRHTRSSQQTDRHSSYVGGVFALYKGDKLYVKVSDPSVVSRDEKGSFFGMFMVAS